MSVQEYNKTGAPRIKIGNWEEERASFEALGDVNISTMRPVGKNSSFSVTNSRVFPNAEYDASAQYATTHKSSFRRQNHLPASQVTSAPHPPRRSDLQRTSILEQARAIHAQQKAELEARIAQEQADAGEGASPFAHRQPLNRQRIMDFHRDVVDSDPLQTAPISIYSEQKLKHSEVLLGECVFKKNSDFTTPIEHYHGHKVWKDGE